MHEVTVQEECKLLPSLATENIVEQLFVSVLEAARLCGAASRGWIYRQEKRDPTFPRLIRLGRRKTVLSLSALRAWAVAQEEGPRNG
jgi:predicted DNA-binding transcriptional regulator AlpA